MVIDELYYDKKDPVNKGVLKYLAVVCAAGVMMNRVVYKCPLTGNVYCFVTSLNKTIPPGLIAFLYKCRWDIEKVIISKRLNSKKWPVFLIAPKRATQRSVKFIRWLRNHLFMNTSWREALGPLQQIYAVFLR
ncbi:MAG: hypothetical protein GX654_03570 [Desulfatiglans sp.]|jgi:hypothetical protein|nr:hypothetical protein [Desulfatiglans sp.]